MTKDKALKLALAALEKYQTKRQDFDRFADEITAIQEALAQPEQEPVLQDIEQYRMQMAGICTAALGYWKEGDGILPDYDTVALRDVAKLYSKYDALYKARWSAQPIDSVEKEPVGTFFVQHWRGLENQHFDADGHGLPDGEYKLYTTPPKRQPLTDEQIADYLGDTYFYMTQFDLKFFKLGEKAAHGIKELNT